MTTYPDPLPFRLRVLRALSNALKTITPANGYLFDLSDFDPGDGIPKARVFRGRAWYGADDPIPMLSILEAVQPGDEVVGPHEQKASQEGWWDLLIQGFVADDSENPTDPAYLLAADVQKRLAQEVGRRLPSDATERDVLGLGQGKNHVVAMQIGKPVARPADDVSDKAYFWMFLRLKLFENALDPYG